jgi:hypothetical protein
VSDDEEIPEGGVEVPPAELEARWSEPWSPWEVADRLTGVSTPWFVAAGWALELFHQSRTGRDGRDEGEWTRPHGDLEIAVPADRFPEIRDRFPGHEFDAVGSGRIWQSPTAHVLAVMYQSWVRDQETGGYRVDVFREPHDGDTWICRRDESIRIPYRDIIERTGDGIPYLSPELVLLFKAKHLRPKDQADFDTALPLMTASRRGLLAELLNRVHPGHAWLASL